MGGNQPEMHSLGDRVDLGIREETAWAASEKSMLHAEVEDACMRRREVNCGECGEGGERRSGKEWKGDTQGFERTCEG